MYGCRGRGFTIFDNAARHIGRKYIASFDLKNFFPSVRLRHILPALRQAQSPLLRITERSPADDGTIHEHIRDFPWTADGALLVAKLVTHRGRLPQGAPTSPAVANIAFDAYDRRIREALGDDFAYTRYVDDITVSISANVAKQRKIHSERMLQEYVRETLETALAGSGFRLNPQKSRCGTLRDGFEITGIRVTESGIELPRRLKRRLRAISHALSTSGFAMTERKLIGVEIVEKTPFDKARQAHLRAGRRLSTERLAVLMLRYLHPKMIVDYDTSSRVKGRFVEENLTERLVGKRAWRFLELLLPQLWTRNMTAEVTGQSVVIRAPAYGEVCCRGRSGGPVLRLLEARCDGLHGTLPSPPGMVRIPSRGGR